MKVICVANLKGGVGKTTTAVNLSHELYQLGHNVLTIDVDMQGNATKMLLTDWNDPNQNRATISELLTDRTIMLSECLMPHEVECGGPQGKQWFICPADERLHFGAQEMLMNGFSWNQFNRLREKLNALQNSQLLDPENDIDYVVCDCAPYLSLPVINAMIAADELLVPVTCDKYALQGLDIMIDQIRNSFEYNPALKAHILVNRWRASKVNDLGMGKLLAYLEDKLDVVDMLDIKVRETDCARRAEQLGYPISIESPTCGAAMDYRALALLLSGKEA